MKQVVGREGYRMAICMLGPLSGNAVTVLRRFQPDLGTSGISTMITMGL